MARNTKKISAAKTQARITLGDQLFAITTRRYTNPGDLLPESAAKKADAIREYASANSAAIAKLTPVTQPAQQRGKQLTGFFTSVRVTVLARAALLLVVLGSGLTLLNYLGDDTIRFEDERGLSALNGEFGHNEKTVSLRMMRKRHKIGEITVEQGTKFRIVKTKNKDSFVINNGPFKAKVRIAQTKENDVHLRFRELGNPMPIGEPQFSIEVIKGNVQIAEVDDDDDFEQYKAGEKAIFSLSNSESL